jgi:hypothetical protein
MDMNKLILPVKFLKAGDLANSEIKTAQTSSGSLQAFGNIALVWKQKLVEQTWILTSHLFMELPSTSYQNETGLRSGYDAGSISAVLSTGRGFGRFYFYSHLGICARSNNYSIFILLD